MKWLSGLLLLASLAFFAYMQWGGEGQDEGRALEAQPPLNAEKIRLLSVGDLASSQSAVRENSACMEWGDFSGGDLERATAALSKFRLGGRLSQRQAEHVSGYWVYLPPLKNSAEVEKKIAELKGYGLEDYFVVQDSGKLHNAISLGVFKTKEAAYKFRDTVRSKGLKSARAGERMSKRTFTVFVLKDPDAALTARMALLQKDFPGSELNAAACSD